MKPKFELSKERKEDMIGSIKGFFALIGKYNFYGNQYKCNLVFRH